MVRESVEQEEAAPGLEKKNPSVRKAERVEIDSSVFAQLTIPPPTPLLCTASSGPAGFPSRWESVIWKPSS